MHETYAEVIKKRLDEDQRNTASVVPAEMAKNIQHGSIDYTAEGKLTLTHEINDRLVRSGTRNHTDLSEAEAHDRLSEEIRSFGVSDWVQQWLDGQIPPGSGRGDFSADYWGECHICDGKGANTCTGCNGTKKVACNNSKCKAGRVDCNYCDGHGKPICKSCNGHGTVTRTYSYPVHKTEVVSCSACSGQKRVGACYHCFMGTNPCPTCDGTLKMPCRRCKGEGQLRCDPCAGVGEAGYTKHATASIRADLTYTPHSDDEAFMVVEHGSPNFPPSPQGLPGKRNLTVDSRGGEASFRYEATADYACTYESVGDTITTYVVHGNPSDGVRTGGNYLERVNQPTAQLLDRRDFDSLNTYPLGRSALKVLANKQAKDPLYAAYGSDLFLEQNLAAARKDALRHVGKGQWGYMVFIATIGLVAGFLSLNWGLRYTAKGMGIPPNLYTLGAVVAGAVLALILLALMERGQSVRGRRLLGDGYLPKGTKRKPALLFFVIPLLIGMALTFTL